MVEKVDAFWYRQADVSMSGSTTPTMLAGLVNCSDLITQNEVYHLVLVNSTRTKGNERLQLLEDFSYLVMGSSLNISITFADLPTNKAAPVLYQLNNWTQYQSLQNSGAPPSTGQYVAHYSIDVTKNITVPVTSTDFYFFLLYLPVETVFQYQFWLNRVYYNYSDYNFTCDASSTNTLCPFELPISSSAGTHTQCLLVLLPNTTDIIYHVNTSVTRRPVNSLSLTLFVLMGLLILVVLSSVIYPWVQPHLGDWCSRDCHMCPKRSYKELS